MYRSLAGQSSSSAIPICQTLSDSVQSAASSSLYWPINGQNPGPMDPAKNFYETGGGGGCLSSLYSGAGNTPSGPSDYMKNMIAAANWAEASTAAAAAARFKCGFYIKMV
jgi:hypothetical protein